MKFADFKGTVFELTSERKQHICFYHPDIIEDLYRLKDILLKPDVVRKSNSDANVLLYYKYFSQVRKGKYIAVVVKTNFRNFILTAYLTEKIKTGKIIYEKE